jgi:hypothetical protein
LRIGRDRLFEVLRAKDLLLAPLAAQYPHTTQSYHNLPVFGNHYLEQSKRDYPDEAYTLTKAYAHGTKPNSGDPWPIRNDKPLNNAYYGTTSSFSSVLGRTATYTGKQVGYNDLLKTNFPKR